MSGHMWKQDKDGNAHPDDSDLLVYTSQQLFADSWENIHHQLAGDAWERTHQHIVRCTDCQQKCEQYTPVCATLRNNLTYQMPAYPSIVEMLGEQIDNPAAAQLALQQRRQKQGTWGMLGTGRQKSRAIAFTPAIPVRHLLVLLAMTIVLAFTIIKYVQTIPSYSSGAVHGAHSLTPLPPQPNPTSKPTSRKSAVTPGNGATGGVPPTAPSGATKPYVAVCSSRPEASQLRVCGYNFKPGDRIELIGIVPGIGFKLKSVVFADAHGAFVEVWPIANCRMVPDYIYAQDLTRHFETPSVPVNVPTGMCHTQNTWPRPGRQPGPGPASMRTGRNKH